MNERTHHELRAQWPDLTKDQRAMELAKIAVGWAEMQPDEQMERLAELVRRARDINDVL